MEIGCGKGEFSRILATKVKSVESIDLSPVMIQKAIEHSKLFPNIIYQTGNIMELPLEDNSYDYIVSIAVFHHLELEEILPKLRRALKPNGVIAILDLYEQSTMIEYLLNLFAIPLNKFHLITKKGKKIKTEEEIEAWIEHLKHDKYMDTNQLRKVYTKLLPASKFKIHLLWRYSMIWHK
ncbi:hypothetical protein PNBC_12465 [Paenibacillus crassostreae]|uniref:Methyltransferase type 11 domain-containing protein n=1 Tax=Paenibacillus crassostreae TaxID=1763538 RepID=A0A167DYJ8_9BACL|nr:hypothetical protein PNBC_12465 [Paenibacillus crassostreae]